MLTILSAEIQMFTAASKLPTNRALESKPSVSEGGGREEGREGGREGEREGRRKGGRERGREGEGGRGREGGR